MPKPEDLFHLLPRPAAESEAVGFSFMTPNLPIVDTESNRPYAKVLAGKRLAALLSHQATMLLRPPTIQSFIRKVVIG